MARLFYKNICCSFLLLVSALSNHAVIADGTPSEIQKRLNEQVLDRPFSVENEATLNSSLNAATERGKPTQIANPTPATGYYGNYYHPYYGYGSVYGLGYYRPYSYYRYTPYYSRYYW